MCKNASQSLQSERQTWIKAENATPEELKKQIDQCPSGALSYKFNTEK